MNKLPTQFIWLLMKVILHENFVCDIASNKQIKMLKFYNMNKNNITDLTKIYNKSKVTLYCTKCDPDLACQDK